MVKIIFLDIDGVLNSQLFYVHGRPGGVGLRSDIDPVPVEFLNELIADTGAKVVVSSTWRLGRSTEELQTLLNQSGFTGEIIGKTKDLRPRVSGTESDSILRGNEILCWIKENQDLIKQDYWTFKHYVIFDDDSDMLYWQRDNFIQTDGYVGLTPTNTWKAKKILNQ